VSSHRPWDCFQWSQYNGNTSKIFVNGLAIPAFLKLWSADHKWSSVSALVVININIQLRES
jgi:hypothetical protein